MDGRQTTVGMQGCGSLDRPPTRSPGRHSQRRVPLAECRADAAPVQASTTPAVQELSQLAGRGVWRLGEQGGGRHAGLQHSIQVSSCMQGVWVSDGAEKYSAAPPAGEQGEPTCCHERQQLPGAAPNDGGVQGREPCGPLVAQLLRLGAQQQLGGPGAVAGEEGAEEQVRVGPRRAATPGGWHAG